ncbi:PQQ-binding-like beta-propeller repeat protein [Streptomyces sp. GESEQ-35]|uniref:outer membrane protein assembly factor BamB family protein n=1 Tax=Streptomyces sp. GESEQ-35 TaxID=2812657 RepID=UPI001B334411|nr:PQQ-binding-like beta-propeller repeat protein [Streptomyces sp. GESEQ-35]
MTQPPPPLPNHPPQSAGFGPPPTLPPPGYGAPQLPPGYGYGHPQSAMAGGRRTQARLTVVVAALLTIALIVVGGVWYANSGRDEGEHATANSVGAGGDTGGQGDEKVPADTGAEVLFQVPMPETRDVGGVVVPGSWLTDKVYVKSGIAEIVGYDADKGTRLWTIPLPGPVCTVSRNTTEDNRTAVVFQPRMPAGNASAGCSQVAAIDLDAGKRLWTRTAQTGDRLIAFSNVTVSGNTVAAGSTGGGAAWDIASARPLWAPKPADTCYDAGYGGGTKLVAVRRCGSSDRLQLHIQTIDPTSGTVISEYGMAQGIEHADVVSTDPLVVAAEAGDTASPTSDLFSVDNRTGRLRSRISLPDDQYAARCDAIGEVENCRRLVVGNDRLYVPTQEHANEIVAFDLATGKQTGKRADAGDGYTISPLRMDGGNVIAYKRPAYGQGGRIVSIDGVTVKETELLENPATRTLLPEYSEILFRDGRLYMSQAHAFRLSGSPEKQYLAIAFGTNG